MDEVTELVIQRTGLAPDVARKAVETVVDCPAARIPPVDRLLKTALRDPVRPDSGEKAGGSPDDAQGKI